MYSSQSNPQHLVEGTNHRHFIHRADIPVGTYVRIVMLDYPLTTKTDTAPSPCPDTMWKRHCSSSLTQCQQNRTTLHTCGLLQYKVLASNTPATPDNDSTLLDKQGITPLQQTSANLCSSYARAINNTTLVALGTIALAQTKGTVKTMDTSTMQLLD